MESDIAISLNNITKSFTVEAEDLTKTKTIFNKYPTTKFENRVLDGINLQIKKGEILGVVGLNGSGKSTLLSILARIMEPDSGTIVTNGKVASILELGMGFHSDLSGRENIYIKGEMYGFSRKELNRRIDSIIDFSGLRQFIDAPLRTYSTGMQGRLAFAIMVNVDAEIMLLDEIMSTGDPSFSMKAELLFKRQLKNGKTVVFASQSATQIEQFCTRAIWINKGKIVADGPAKTVCAKFQESILDSIEMIVDFANSGVPDAQYKLAQCYKDGIKIEKNMELYEEWLAKAAIQGHTQAQVQYADILISNKNEEKIDEAKALYLSAAKQGNNEARLKISTLFNDKKSLGDIQELRSIMLQLAQVGHPINKLHYGVLMLNTAWNDDDRREAFSWIKKSVNEGNVEAMHYLGAMYLDGIGVKQDVELAIGYLEKAAECNLMDSIRLLTDLYTKGRAIAKNDEKAYYYCLKGAKLGNVRMQFQVATMYHDGIGTDVNLEEANRWFTIYSNSQLVNCQLIAADQLKQFSIDTDATPESLLKKAAATYNLRAINSLLSLYKNAHNTIPNIEDIRNLALLSAQWPGRSQLELADMYYRGVFFEQNYEEAAKIYLRLKSECDPIVDYRLHLMYEHGLGIEQDPNLAQYYLERSANRGYLEAQSELKKKMANAPSNAGA